ncbi:MAG TPA: VOC family protein [Tissierellia bacterium]|nr:VOC family protein [Tissierellia bacterium]
MRMEHVTIYTNDLEKSVMFYQEMIGLDVTGDLRDMGSPIVFLCGPEGGTQVELIESPEEAYTGKGLSIGFFTEDVEKAREKVMEKGYSPTEIISPHPDVRFFFFHDPNGVKIQFIGK